MIDPNPFTGHALYSPTFPSDDAAALLADCYGLQAVLTPLQSHQDQNFRADTPHGRYVLKIANRTFSRTALEAQNAAMAHLDRCGLPFAVPVPQPARDGAFLTPIARSGTTYHVRLLTYLDGVPLEQFRYLAPPVLQAVGALAARTAVALGPFDHPGVERILQWDCRHAGAVVAALAPSVADPRRRTLAERVMDRVEEDLAPLAAALRTQVIHADVTTVNLVATRNRAGQPELRGLIDFGDLCRTWLVAELAVPIVSLIPHDSDHPLHLARAALRGFHAVLPLTDGELAGLWPTVLARAALDAVSGAHQAVLEPHNRYVSDSQEDAWRTLECVAAVEGALAHEVFRAAVGRPPSPRVCAVTESATSPTRPMIDLPAGTPCAALDLSVQGSALREGAWAEPTRVRDFLTRAADGVVPIGRYGEARLLYARTDQPDETACVHLGIDVVVPPGTAVRAPVAATVVRLEESTLVLRAAGYDVRLAGVAPLVTLGAAVAGGQEVATVAEPSPAAPLPAHLHVQLVAVAGLEAPGLAVPSLAEAWRALCPDPSPLLGVSATALEPRPAALLGRRTHALARVQQHYYAEPPQIERGWRHHLYDTDGRAYLDMINNVAILGHSHPGVAAAVERQLRLLNTNSRFHYDLLVRFAERLRALLPAPLDTVFLVSTGSEANDLALRLIRSATGQRDVLAVRSAYHGWTTATDEISTSLADHPGASETRPPWVHPVLSPNTYRGPYRGADAAGRYADDVRAVLERLHAEGRGVAGFIAEALYGNAGGSCYPRATCRRCTTWSGRPAASVSPMRCRSATAAWARRSGRSTCKA